MFINLINQSALANRPAIKSYNRHQSLLNHHQALAGNHHTICTNRQARVQALISLLASGTGDAITVAPGARFAADNTIIIQYRAAGRANHNNNIQYQTALAIMASGNGAQADQVTVRDHQAAHTAQAGI